MTQIELKNMTYFIKCLKNQELQYFSNFGFLVGLIRSAMSNCLDCSNCC